MDIVKSSIIDEKLKNYDYETYKASDYNWDADRIDELYKIILSERRIKL